jgi:lysophospholipase L1-like esterase
MTSADERVNPLYEAKFKRRSADTTNKAHIPLLSKKGESYELVFLGDSHIERLLTTGSGKHYTQDKELVEVEGRDNLWQRFVDAKTVNLGIGGDGIQNLLHRLFQLGLVNYLPTKPRDILIWIGTNDIDNYDDEMVHDAIVHLVTCLQKSYKDINQNPHITVMSMLPKFSRTDSINTGDLNRSIQRLNYRLAHSSEKHDFKFLDVFYHFYHDNKILTQYYMDNCHLNYDGYKILVGKLREYYFGEAPPPETNTDHQSDSRQGGQRGRGGYRQREDSRQREDYRQREDSRQREDFRQREDSRQRGQREDGEQRERSGYRPRDGNRQGGYRPRDGNRQGGYRPRDVTQQDGQGEQSEQGEQRERGGYRPRDGNRQGGYRPRDDTRQGGQGERGGYRPRDDSRQNTERPPRQYRPPSDDHQSSKPKASHDQK